MDEPNGANIDSQNVPNARILVEGRSVPIIDKVGESSSQESDSLVRLWLGVLC